MIGVPVKYFQQKSFSLHKLDGFGEFRGAYLMLGCLKMFKFLTETLKVEKQTQKMQLKLFFVKTL